MNQEDGSGNVRLERQVRRTENGSTVTITKTDKQRNIYTVDLDWFEEDNACIECEVDFYASSATDWDELVWRCDYCCGGSAKLTVDA